MALETFEELFDRASRAMKEGFVDNALVPATEAAKAAPERWEPRLLLARIWLEMGRPDRALSDARAVLSTASGSLPHDANLQAHDVVARASLALGDATAAEMSLRVLDATPAQAPSAVRLAVLLLSQKRVPEAREVLDGAAARHPGHGVAFAAASAAIAAGSPRDSAVELALAELELEVGLVDESRRRFQAELSRDPSSERAQAGFRQAATGRSAPRAVAPVARSSGLRSILIRGAIVLLLLLGGLTVYFAKTHASEIEAMGQNPRQLLITGLGLMFGGLILSIADLRRSRAAGDLAGTGHE